MSNEVKYERAGVLNRAEAVFPGNGDILRIVSGEWREPLGALRITPWDDNPPDWQIQRARNEVEWLTRVLNGLPGKGLIEMKAMGEEA